jgi:hypothetical protein
MVLNVRGNTGATLLLEARKNLLVWTVLAVVDIRPSREATLCAMVDLHCI